MLSYLSGLYFLLHVNWIFESEVLIMKIVLFMPYAICTGIATWFGDFLGGIDKLLSALLTIMTLDYITNTIAPINKNRLSFNACYNMLWKKVIAIFTVGISNIIDILTNANGTLRDAVILYYIIENSLSFFKSAEKLESIPPFLKSVIEYLKNKINKHK